MRYSFILICAAFLGACSQPEPESALCAPVEGGAIEYTAIARAHGVTVSAALDLPRPNYTVSFIQRPERIAPPIYDLTCVPPAGATTQVVTKHTASIVVTGASAGDKITVHDASGAHSVPVMADGDTSAGGRE